MCVVCCATRGADPLPHRVAAAGARSFNGKKFEQVPGLHEMFDGLVAEYPVLAPGMEIIRQRRFHRVARRLRPSPKR